MRFKQRLAEVYDKIEYVESGNWKEFIDREEQAKKINEGKLHKARNMLLIVKHDV